MATIRRPVRTSGMRPATRPGVPVNPMRYGTNARRVPSSGAAPRLAGGPARRPPATGAMTPPGMVRVGPRFVNIDPLYPPVPPNREQQRRARMNALISSVRAQEQREAGLPINQRKHPPTIPFGKGGKPY